MKLFFLLQFFLILLKLSRQNQENPRYLNCSGKGVYVNSLSDCSCIPGYDTYPQDSEVRCNYELRTRQIALFCSIVGGIIGADMFYLGHTFRGVFKSLFPMFVMLFVLRIQNYKAIQAWRFSYYFSFLPLIILLFFWLIDFLLIFNGNIKDTNGLGLYFN